MPGPSAPLLHIRPKATDSTLEFWWSPPVSDGGSPIQIYILTDGTNTITTSETYYKYTGLTNKTPYSFSVAASNLTEVGEYASFRTVEPGLRADPPQFLQGTSLTSTTALLTWINPNFDGNTPNIYRNVIKAYSVDSNYNINNPSTILFQQFYGIEDGNAFSTIVSVPSSINGHVLSIQGVNDPGFALQTFTNPVCPTPFYPTDIPGCYLWCDAKALNLQNNDSITTWNSSGGLGQALTGSATYKTNIIGSNPVVQFNTSEAMSNATGIGVPLFPYNLFTISRQTGGTNARVFLDIGQNTLYGYWNSNKNVWYTEGWLNETGASSDTNWDLYTFSKTNDGTCTMNRFGSTIITGVTNTYGINGFAINDGVYGNEKSDSQIGEIILFSTAMSVSSIQKVEGYLAWKWGFQSNLPSTHPYKNVKPY